VLFFVPYNHTLFPPPGSEGAAVWSECKRRVAAIRVAIPAWFRKCHFQVAPEIDRALRVRGFLVLGVTLI
jgi:hypothetical protein